MDLEERRINLVYESSVEKLTEVNSSFDRGVLRVAYAGKNRNHSYISRETFEKCIPTIYNCPIVCNYNRETNSIGAHVSLDRMGLMAEYGLTAADIDFNIEEYTLDELKEKFEEIRANSESLAAENENADSPENETAADDSPTPEQTGAEEAVDNSFSLTGEQFLEELLRELESVTYEDAKYGTLLRYWFVDYDSGKSEVYCYDCADWLLYGFSYSMSGDRVVIDFDNKHRKKVSYEDFVEGDSAFSIKAILTSLSTKRARLPVGIFPAVAICSRLPRKASLAVPRPALATRLALAKAGSWRSLAPVSASALPLNRLVAIPTM